MLNETRKTKCAHGTDLGQRFSPTVVLVREIPGIVSVSFIMTMALVDLIMYSTSFDEVSFPMYNDTTLILEP